MRVAGACGGDGAELTQLFVRRDRRGKGYGRALISAAIRAAEPSRDLWVAADRDDWPKHLYAKIGFVGVWTMAEFSRPAT